MFWGQHLLHPPPTHLLVVFSYSCVYRLTLSSLIGGVSADRLTNSLFINGPSVSGSQRWQRRTIQFPPTDVMSPWRAIFITSIKTLIIDKKMDRALITWVWSSDGLIYLLSGLLLCPWRPGLWRFTWTWRAVRKKCVHGGTQSAKTASYGSLNIGHGCFFVSCFL